MSRMLEALKQLERRGARTAAPQLEPVEWPPDAPRGEVVQVTGFDPYRLEQTESAFEAASYVDPVAEIARLDDPLDQVQRPPVDQHLLALRLSGADYQPIARQTVEIIDLRGSRNFVVHSVSADSDEALSLPTLGLALARELGRRVLLIHTDRRLRCVIDDAPGDPLAGLSDALAGISTWSLAIHHTSEPSLDLIPRGETPLRGGALSELNFPGSWAAEYGAVLIGCHSTSQPLSIELARLADGTIFAVRNGSVQRDTLQKIGAAFQAAGARPLGCFVLD
jgi:Mrp family chromosome partitioning ATPase